MRHNVSGRKLNRSSSHRKMLYRNLVTALFRHERIQTTVPKAKEARSLAERLITYAKAGDLNSRRLAAKRLPDPAVLQKLFAEIAPRYTDRPCGYTRILRLSGARKGDNAELAILELVDSTAKPKSSDSAKRKKARRILKMEEKAEAKAALEETAADEAAVEETEDTVAVESQESTDEAPEAVDEESADEDETEPKKD